MAKKKATKKRSHLALTKKKGENKELDGLPSQEPPEICLYNTDTALLEGLENPATFHDGLVQLKVKFLWEIQEWSKRYGVDTRMRVYFEIKPEG